MIEFYTWGTPNGQKVSIMLEEIGLPYRVHPIDILKDEQFAPDFLEISPNNKIPAIVDTETGQALMESGAILLYLAEKTGQLWPQEPHRKWDVMQWLMWQMGGFGPMLGQAHHFLHYNAGKSDYAEDRYGNEAKRLWGVLDKRLSAVDFVAGTYSIADIAIWPWASRYPIQGIEISDYPNVVRWYREVAARPAVQRGWNVPERDDSIPMP
ncbi:glutathione S-transferase N-terminal domain-containing protein [Methyloligella sp. 2.7D]|uniref:glutathione S-transferase family protein n=1 Tax=unclassified Methyloligella TaxID=2625955 RepID=UPI00157D88C5|nr:glutathione S-transferase N-terminal domain-containing protein [Methyloligella sp. GL2]QKP77173.1 glutathione S-transferase N-terminal domain-containing protein [Methyloligella sp. GL2]